MTHTESNANVVLAQRYAYATVALVVALLSFVNLFGFEKSILAVVLGLKALGDLRHCARCRSDRVGGDRDRAEHGSHSESDCGFPSLVGRILSRVTEGWLWNAGAPV
jgi:hypothetical protein